jgi:dipeptidyl-peptidase-4
LETRDRATGKVQAQLTQGPWDVTGVQAVDEDQGVVYFTATKESPLERQLYKVPLKGGEPVRLTSERGVHVTQVSPKAGVYVDIHSARDRAPKAVVRDMTGAILGALPVPEDKEIDALKVRPREMVSFKGPSGDTLYGALLAPRDAKPGDKHPVIVHVYGGPGVQTVLDMWSPSLFWQHLADRGFVVFQMDNRGSTGRGPAFEHPIANRLGKVEMEDQLAGVAYLKTLPYVDGSRMGIYGASYGGFMTALAMFDAPGVFQVGVSAAPVTEWQLYDTAYTERYMGTPKGNAAGYDASDLTKKVGGLTGKLLLVHALMDENVHFQNSADLIDALVNANKPFDLLVFPGERHGYRSPPARKYALRKVVGYFADNL